jgi:hypothetical protein
MVSEGHGFSRAALTPLRVVILRSASRQASATRDLDTACANSGLGGQEGSLKIPRD